MSFRTLCAFCRLDKERLQRKLCCMLYDQVAENIKSGQFDVICLTIIAVVACDELVYR